MNENRKVCLIVLDGWGHGAKDSTDAVFTANTPFMDSLEQRCPNAELVTYGEAVGLPEGQMGNSEVGHMNIGAGRVVYQDLVRINRAVSDRSIFSNRALCEALEGAGDGALHFIGLIGEGGVHSSQAHLHALLEMAKLKGCSRVYVHAFMDGRDSDPKAGLNAIDQLEAVLLSTGGKIASVVGRYYAMDRDKRWERVKRAYDLLLHRNGDRAPSARKGVEEAYTKGFTDEFIEPLAIDGGARIEPGDTVICFNFRTDRCREITEVLTQQAFPEFDMQPLYLRYFTMTRYDATYRNVGVAFEKDDLAMTLGEVVSAAGRTQLRIAETEKYPHVTFFFSGGREAAFSGEQRIMISSPKVATYDLQPAMSTLEVTQAAIEHMRSVGPDFIALNFANPDMVGHTGVFSAIVQAVEATDACLQQVVDFGLTAGYSFVVIADHGNADRAINADGTMNTAHTLNPVPIVVIDNRVQHVASGILADVAPTVLHLMGLPAPKEMTGDILVS
jgi:2,3-bisphosphoglycerate-independent phosphoglycerate mutase